VVLSNRFSREEEASEEEKCNLPLSIKEGESDCLHFSIRIEPEKNLQKKGGNQKGLVQWACLSKGAFGEKGEVIPYFEFKGRGCATAGNGCRKKEGEKGGGGEKGKKRLLLLLSTAKEGDFDMSEATRSEKGYRRGRKAFSLKTNLKGKGGGRLPTATSLSVLRKRGQPPSIFKK